MNEFSKADFDRMQIAISLAKHAASKDEVPVGAVVTHDDQIIATGFNQREHGHKITGHAELIALEAVCAKLKSWRIPDCDLYVSLEPCVMCASAIVQARIRRCIFAAPDPKGGGFGSLYDLSCDNRLNHTVEVVRGVLETESSELLKSFFRKKRK